MWFNLLMFLFFLAVWYFQTIQGAFSALIMALLTLFAVCVTYDSFEAAAALLNSGLGGYRFLEGYEYGVGFLLCFGGCLFVSRFIFDRAFPANMYFNPFIDRSLAAGFGLFTSLAISGSVAVGFQLLPFGPAITGYDRVGILAEPDEGKEKQSITDMNRWFVTKEAMHFTAAESAALTRKMWLDQDSFSAGLYCRMLLDNDLIANGIRRPKDVYGDDLASDEILARCWDWRIQSRFRCTPVALRVPLFSVTNARAGDRKNQVTPKQKLRVVRAMRISEDAFNRAELNRMIKPAEWHVLVSVQAPRGAGVPNWYMATDKLGGIRSSGKESRFPPVVPDGLRVKLSTELKDDDDDKNAAPANEYLSFSYWQMRLIGFNEKGEGKEYPLRSVLGLSFADSATKGKAGGKAVSKAFQSELERCNQASAPSGSIAVLMYPPRGVLQFRLLFRISRDFAQRVQLVYTSLPKDTAELAIADIRDSRLDWLMPPGTDPRTRGIQLRTLNTLLVDDAIDKWAD